MRREKYPDAEHRGILLIDIMKGTGRQIFIGLIIGLITFLFSLLPVSELFELKGYDLFYLFKKPEHPPDDIVIVAIDEPSFAELEKQWPWPRGLHARLIDTLKKEGASVIGLDILFSEPSQVEEDRALSDAIKRAGNVVLASDIEMIKDKRYTQEMVIEPISILKERVSIGLVTIPIDRDNVVRRFYHVKEGERLFAEEITHLYSKKIYQVPEGAYISYSGPQRGFNTISYYQALEPSIFLPKNFFRGKIVLVGKSIKTPSEPERPSPDLFATPFLFSKEGNLMSGVEIQANMVNNHLRGKFVMRFSRFGNILIFLIIGLAGSFLQIRWRPVLNGILTFIFFIMYLVIAYYVFVRYTLWIPTLLVILPISIPYGVSGINAYIQSEKKRKEIKRAFSHYLSPSILEVILASPENLRLGGEKVEVTVLFSDIANFTAMAETMPPEDVASFLNRYLDEMTKTIFEHKGTVDKFIGDAVMAFWGAPLPDENHSLNACRAAIAMQERLKSSREEFRQRGLPEIFVRIGINSGIVIAGNMGSSELFDYTVLGDTVNLASRLEGANKEFGTSIIISNSVYERVAANVIVRPLGMIKVKGKTKEVEIYELVKASP